MFSLHHYAILLLRAVLLVDHHHSRLLAVLAWFIRLIVLSLLLRSYIIPWLLALTSRRIRVRTISLRSIRGLYIDTGAHVCRVERIGYLWSNVSGSRRITIRIEGLNLDISNGKTPKLTRHKRSLTLADLSPSPLARRLWGILGDLYVLTEPHIRPYLRAWVAAYLRFVIRWLPRLSRAVTFDLHAVVVTLRDVQRMEFSTESVQLHTELSLTPLGVPQTIPGNDLVNRAPRPRPLYGLTAWRKRFQEGFQRSLDRALGETKGTASVSLQLQNLSVSTMLSDVMDHKPLAKLPGKLDFNLSASFNPRLGVIDDQSLRSALKVGDCVIHADSLSSFINELLEVGKPVSAPSSTPNVGCQFDVQSGLSPPMLSPAPSSVAPSTYAFESPFLSPLLSSKVPSISSITSPTSPLLEAISASLRSRRPRFIVPCKKLKDSRSKSTLSIIGHIQISISRVNIVYLKLPAQSDHSYQNTIRDIFFETFHSSPSSNSYHLDILGRQNVLESFDPKVLGARFSISCMTLERHTTLDVWKLCTFGPMSFQGLLSQWPFPWLSASPFMCGDPNAALLAVRGRLDGVIISERLEDLQQFLSIPLSSGPQSHGDGPSQAFKTLPRILVELSCGPLSGSVICKGPDGLKPLVVQLKSKGFSLTSSSYYRSSSVIPAFPLAFDYEHLLQLRWDSSLSIEPVFAVVHPNVDKVNVYEPNDDSIPGVELLHHPTACSVETINIRCQLSALAGIDDIVGAIARVDTSTLVLEAHVSNDAVCIELWNPDVVAAILQVLTIFPANLGNRPPSGNEKKSSLVGLSLSLGLARLVVFVTAPDLNPQDDLGLSRGVALRTNVSVHWCLAGSKHIHSLHHIQQRSMLRRELGLSVETALHVFAPAVQQTKDCLQLCKLLELTFSELLIRGAVATPFEADDPLIGEGDSPSFIGQDFVRVEDARITVSLQSAGQGNNEGECDISVVIPYVSLRLHPSHVYELLLASQTLRSFQQVRSSRDERVPPILSARTKCSVTEVQVLCILPKQRTLFNIKGLVTSSSPERQLLLHSHTTQFCVISPEKHGYTAHSPGEWEELVLLQSLDLRVPSPDAGSPTIVISGDSGRISIPNGYVFSDLVFDVIVVSKALRHIFRITNAGRYEDFPVPEPEGPKAMPQIEVMLGYLCLEASDDPLESRLGFIWRAGFDAAKQRLDREEAFQAKVAAIYAAEADKNGHHSVSTTSRDYSFNATHTVPVQQARQRLDEVHALDWKFRLEQEQRRISRGEQNYVEYLRSSIAPADSKPIFENSTIPDLVEEVVEYKAPPLFRAVLFDLDLKLSPPSFALEDLPNFLHVQGGLPLGTEYSLLIPMHLQFTLSAVHATLRDYPLPLFSIPAPRKENSIAWKFETDLVFAEEMGTNKSVDWIECPLILPNQGAQGVLPLSITVPKTIMPVKSYANATIQVSTDQTTAFSWGVSYGPAIQDLMRIIDTLSSSSRDDSPSVGFWDKLRLIFHWTLNISFMGDVILHMKGSHNPYDTIGTGAGFVLAWQGNSKLLINCNNVDKELFQVTSDTLIFAIPEYVSFIRYMTLIDEYSLDETMYNHSHPAYLRGITTKFRKICAKFQSGVRFGIGCVLERSCGIECPNCKGPALQRKCRLFDFAPHYAVKLEKKAAIPKIKSHEDSFNNFRSDFVHLSISLTSSLHKNSTRPSSFHLTPKAFAHFWSWWSLFDGVLSLPIRQGTYYPRRIITPKLGRHLATIKYRIVVPRLSITHAYIDDSGETWVDGVTPWIGLKGMIDSFQADFHQRDEEASVAGPSEEAQKVLRKKAFYAAEVVLRGIDLRAFLTIFPEARKKGVKVPNTLERSSYRTRKDLPPTDLSSHWYDPADFIETDWASRSSPKFHMLPVAACPHFAYFKRNSAVSDNEKLVSKFGIEKSHTCLLGTELPIDHIQAALARSRIKELKEGGDSCTLLNAVDQQQEPDMPALERAVSLLEDYVASFNPSPTPSVNDHLRNYVITSESVTPSEWAEFDNVYHVHCPKIFLDAAIRDIMMRYYYCSRARIGFEYHLATRAMKFIRDQAEAAIAVASCEPEQPTNPAFLATSVLRKLLRGDNQKSSVVPVTDPTFESLESIDPMSGWFGGVTLKKSHFCLLLKPQVVLRGELDSEACVVAAMQAKLQSYAIMDDMNASDPVSGKIMSRNYTAFRGLQAFAPSCAVNGKGCVPLEVLVDLKCESDEFDRLVPQTDAIFHYDKFNKLRLRNNVNAAVNRGSEDGKESMADMYYLQTDLLRVHVPRFTVSANDKHFQSIASIVTKLLLFSDAAHKTRLERLEHLLITYDFTDLASVAGVVEKLQCRLRSTLESEEMARLNHRRWDSNSSDMDILNIRAHVVILAEELHLLFDAIRLAQDRSDGRSDRKSALLLHASSSLITWNMLAEGRELISKLEVQDPNFYWLNRQDGSIVNNLILGNLQAFDGSRDAQWTEILSKHDEAASHPQLKNGLFLIADWVVLPPVGGITVYETFELSVHPIRLQIDSKVGRRIMEYLWPARRDRRIASESDVIAVSSDDDDSDLEIGMRCSISTRSSLDSPRALHVSQAQDSLLEENVLSPPLRRLGTSRSFTTLRPEKQTVKNHFMTNHASHSEETLTSPQLTPGSVQSPIQLPIASKETTVAEIKHRSAQKTFILVRITSLVILLSVLKEGSFEWHDVRIKTRQLEYHNQTCSFEELVNHFIPSNKSWRGWVKMALHQPLVPVFPVARELLLKTKLIASKGGSQLAGDKGNDKVEYPSESSKPKIQSEGLHPFSTLRSLKGIRKQTDHRSPILPSPQDEVKGYTRRRVRSFFGRNHALKETDAENE
ncbi:hypothetical protein AMATHDRAFT_139321 [Amanita thiersii Skay4041]|uniref:Golgi-body localization protein domain-containing protein n=1 Tax=Amanita thiersii Skay4041 TaxID=703135 RepID=A0A2A9NYB6_9AGAR|nr:hypothetical protein AMATHDRAFT_139321 [Amanita thiersii Skay4041]